MALNLDFSFLTPDVIKTNILPGLYYSLQLTLVTMVCGTILGTLVALMRLSSKPWLQRIAAIYVDTLRSIPLLMVILWFYLLIPSAFYAFIAGSFGANHRPEFAAVITFVVCAFVADRLLVLLTAYILRWQDELDQHA